jgi:hypothetical protein
VQDKDPQKHEANSEQVFGGFVPSSFHLGFILQALRMVVVKPKCEKSAICWLSRLRQDHRDPDAGAEMTLL